MVATAPCCTAGVPGHCRSLSSFPGESRASTPQTVAVPVSRSRRLNRLSLLIVRLCLEVSLLIFVTNSKQNLFIHPGKSG